MEEKQKWPREVEVYIRMSNLLAVNPVDGYVKIDCSIRAIWKLTAEEQEKIGNQKKFTQDEWKGFEK